GEAFVDHLLLHIKNKSKNRKTKHIKDYNKCRTLAEWYNGKILPEPV
ncbi:2374_t:CDS:1, partial [Racocetra persica]